MDLQLLDKCIRVINGCDTLSHFVNAERFVWFALKEARKRLHGNNYIVMTTYNVFYKEIFKRFNHRLALQDLAGSFEFKFLGNDVENEGFSNLTK